MRAVKSIRARAFTWLLILAFNFVFCYGVVSPNAPQASAATGGQTAVSSPADYGAAVAVLERFIAHEMTDKGIPALSIALVDDQRIVWSQGFGFADPKGKVSATAETIYRVGSVSKLFTDIAVMQLVEQGKIDLDAPVTRYLPDFRPRNLFGKPITLRQLMSHRSGLVREPPVGNYFDPTAPSLSQTISSLNDTALGGYTNFNRYYFAQVHKDAAVIDERFNGGGTAADYIIDYLRRPLMNYWATREGEVFTTPVGSIYGPKVMIVNEFAGSGGDLLPWLFRKAGGSAP